MTVPGPKVKGQQTLEFENPPVITAWASLVGPKEGQGPWGADFDRVLDDYMFEEKTWEKAESKMLRETVKMALHKNNYQPEDVELLVCGDLLNQISSSNFAARELSIPFLGLYGACSTMSQSLLTAAMIIDGGYFARVVAGVSSHHYTAERQFRFPTEQGTQPNPSTQWTATAAGAVLVEAGTIVGPKITSATIGKVIDLGQKDPADMGSAMAPAAADTIKTHLNDLNRPPDYYDLVVTGDLGQVGSTVLRHLFIRDGIVPDPNYSDCGVLLYNDNQGVESGGSGCGCCASMLCGPLLKKMMAGEINKLLVVATGALMSPTSSFQGESIPGIAHAVAIENV
ncbi:stage V sporulation protein AD [Syntrophomonas erecta]